MAKEVFVQIGDDLSRVVAKLQRERAVNLTLVFPKGSLILASEAKLKLLKRHIAEIGKSVNILTNDIRGREHAIAVGFDLAGTDAGAKRTATSETPATPAKKIQPKAQPTIIQRVERAAAPIVAPIVEPVQRIFETPAYQPNYQVPNQSHQPRSRKTFGRKSLAAVLAAALLIFIFVAAFVLPQATVIIYAKAQPITRDLQISIDQNVKSASASQLSLPGSMLDSDQQAAKTYQTTGKQNVGLKAQGNVQIYNYSGRILKFNAATTTFTAGGMVFHLQKDVSGIKPTKNIGSTQNADPSSLIPEVPVIADQPGDLYNLPAGTKLELHNAALGDSPTVYAIATKAIDGGVSRFTTAVSQEDLDKAATDLKTVMVTAAKQQLINTKGLTLLDSGAQTQTNTPVFDKKIGDSSVNFSGTVIGHIKALLFNNDSLKKVVEQRVSLTLSQNQELGTGKTEVITATFKSLDLDKGTAILNVHFESVILPKIDLNDTKSKLAGQSPNGAQSALNMPNIQRIDVKLSPFWVKTIPSWTSHVNVEVQS
jgi:hypothetical protein